MAPRTRGAVALEEMGGKDSLGAAYSTPAEMWQAEVGGGAAGSSRADWYGKGLRYWEALPATVSTVLGGYERVSPSDIKSSDAFLHSVFPAVALRTASGRSASRRLVAADLGAGVGRVTEHLLQRHFDEVSVIEPVAHYLDAAREKLAPGGSAALAGCACSFVCEPLQEWTPGKGTFDVIWVQWCLGHLTDDDFVTFFGRCAAGLRKDGLIVVKENNCKEGFIVDKDDSSLTRSHDYFLALFERAGLEVVKVALQKGFPSELFAVRMYALRPR